MNTYRETLRAVLTERIKNNSNYSMRAFAKNLGLQAPRLSLILSHKQGISEELAKKIASKLNLNKLEYEIFVTSAIAEDARSKVVREQAKIRFLELCQEEKGQLSEDEFKLVAEWHHYALLELLTTQNVQHNANWFARRLDISELEVEQSLECLMKCHLIELKDEKYIPTQHFTTTTNNIPSIAVRQYQRDVLKKAIFAIDEQKLEERDYSSLTFGLDRTKMAEVKLLIKDFRRTLNKYVENMPVEDRDSVFQLNISLFNLTRDLNDDENL